jgi:hypothetical protein
VKTAGLNNSGASRSKSEDLVHELNLPDGVTFGEPLDLSFADHVHRFVALNGVESAIHRSEPETGSDSPFNKAVILLARANRRKCLAAIASRLGESMTSIVSPLESMARYR